MTIAKREGTSIKCEEFKKRVKDHKYVDPDFIGKVTKMIGKMSLSEMYPHQSNVDGSVFNLIFPCNSVIHERMKNGMTYNEFIEIMTPFAVGCQFTEYYSEMLIYLTFLQHGFVSERYDRASNIKNNMIISNDHNDTLMSMYMNIPYREYVSYIYTKLGMGGYVERFNEFLMFVARCDESYRFDGSLTSDTNMSIGQLLKIINRLTYSYDDVIEVENMFDPIDDDVYMTRLTAAFVVEILIILPFLVLNEARKKKEFIYNRFKFEMIRTVTDWLRSEH